MKLNLGCGRVIFPLNPDDDLPYRAHLEPLPETCFQPGWVNVDKYKNPGVQETIDLFQFPWIRGSNNSPFNDDSIDEIYCGHIVEHIPHKVGVHPMIPVNWSRHYHEMTATIDGFFIFFAEIYRLLKPGGLIHIRAPYALSTPALADPTHTRYLVPGSFSYLGGDNSEAPFNYHLPMKFEVIENGVQLRFTAHGAKLIEAWRDSMSAINPEDEEAFKRAKIALEAEIYRSFDVADEMRIIMRAVKE